MGVNQGEAQGGRLLAVVTDQIDDDSLLRVRVLFLMGEGESQGERLLAVVTDQIDDDSLLWVRVLV